MATEKHDFAMEQDRLISIIVPVYRVEPWLEECVSSIRAQTYRNLEIILVDDGSPDRCGEICDRLAREDGRIRVLHQKNGGLSAARNSGLDLCRGEFLGFVDSDDTIHPEMYARLLENITQNNVKLSFCHTVAYDAIKDRPGISKFAIPNETECLSASEVIRMALDENKWFSVYTKLYHRSLFDNLRFPINRTNEDYPTTLRIFDRCDTIVVDYCGLYSYRKRENSITTAPINDHSFDQAINGEDVYLYIKKTHPEFAGLAARFFLSACCGLLLKTDGILERRFSENRKIVVQLIRKYYPAEKHRTPLSCSQKILLSAACRGMTCYKMVSYVYRFLKKN
jgi:glycosyltransferase involved in cell wall biosynthesis